MSNSDARGNWLVEMLFEFRRDPFVFLASNPIAPEIIKELVDSGLLSEEEANA